MECIGNHANDQVRFFDFVPEPLFILEVQCFNCSFGMFIDELYGFAHCYG